MSQGMTHTTGPAKVDTKEFELPETLFVRDIENSVFQSIVLQCLAKISGISLLEGNFIDSLLGRGTLENVKGIFVEQDNRHSSVSIRAEINVCYGVSIPEKAEEIQGTVAEEITRLTGLHVSCVHVIFKSVVLVDAAKRWMDQQVASRSSDSEKVVEREYSDQF
jgi:uncharacterized alkaline shock family protein YloU